MKNLNLSQLIPNREKMKFSSSRHNSYIKEENIFKNMSDASSYFYDDASLKGEDEIMNNLSVQLSLTGIEGELRIGGNTDIEIIFSKISSKISLSNGILNTMDFKI